MALSSIINNTMIKSIFHTYVCNYLVKRWLCAQDKFLKVEFVGWRASGKGFGIILVFPSDAFYQFGYAISIFVPGKSKRVLYVFAHTLVSSKRCFLKFSQSHRKKFSRIFPQTFLRNKFSRMHWPLRLLFRPLPVFLCPIYLSSCRPLMACLLRARPCAGSFITSVKT